MEELAKRSYKLRESVIDEENRTVSLSFSSEDAVDMGYCMQVLEHEGADFSRLNDKAPLLLNHDRDKQIGVVEKAWTEDGKGRAQVRFSKSSLGEEIFNDVKDGIRQLVSVGYKVDDSHASRSEDGVETEIVTNWQPLEISIVSIPADQGVGVGRAIEPNKETSESKSKMENTQTQDTADTAVANVDASRSVDTPVKFEVIERKLQGEFEKKLQEQKNEFKRELEKLQAQAKQDSPVTESRKEDYAKAGFSVQRAIANKVQNGSWGGLEKEISDEIRGKGGNYQSDESLIIPFQRSVTTATSGAKGGNIQDISVQEPVDALRATTFFDKVGARVLSGLSSSVKIPRLDTKSTVAVNTEGSAISGQADPVFEQESLDPLILQGQVDISKSLLATNVVGADEYISRDINSQLGSKMETLAIEGTGSSGQPQGLKTLSGATTSVSSGTNGTAYTYTDIVKMTQDTSAANASLESSKFLASAKGWGKLRRTEISSNTAMFTGTREGGVPMIADFESVISNNVPSADTKGSGTNLTHYYFGDWSYMVVGMFGSGIEVTVDPYTQAGSNIVRLHAIVLFDVAWTQPAAFARLLDAITA